MCNKYAVPGGVGSPRYSRRVPSISVHPCLRHALPDQSTSKAAPESRDYEARHLLVLEGLEAVRKRPAMYIGSTDTRGLMHCLWEIIDNAVDEALGGFGSEILVTLNGDGSISVSDRGRGIPVDIEPRTGLAGVEVVFTKLHAGGKFGAGSYNATGGLHGVGSSVVNALATRLDVEVDRDGATWAMSFRRGVAGTFDGPGPTAKFTPGSGLRKVGRVKRGVSGTRVRYWPDRQIFLRDAQLSLSDLYDRARQTSFLVPGLALEVVDARTREVTTERFLHAGGITEFCEFLAPDEALTDVVRLQGTDEFVETVPMLDDDGHMTPTDVERQLDIDIAVRWGDRVRDQDPVVRQHHRDAEGRHPRRRFRARAWAGPSPPDAEHPAAQGGGGDHQGRHHRGSDRGGHRTSRRAAVRGPDQGGARHPGGVPAGDQGHRAGTGGLPDLDQGLRSAPRAGPCWRRW